MEQQKNLFALNIVAEVELVYKTKSETIKKATG